MTYLFVRTNRAPDTIYVVKPVGFDGPFKIGATSNVPQRLRHLSNASPFPLELVCTHPGGIELEHRIHASLRSSHLRCEWFSDSAAVRGLIEQLKAGTLDVAVLPAPFGIANAKPRARKAAA
jgi:hypothetical protein